MICRMVSSMRSRSMGPVVVTSSTRSAASTAASTRSVCKGGVSISTHSSSAGAATVNRLTTSTPKGSGRPADRALCAHRVAAPDGSASRTVTVWPSRASASAVPMALVVLPTPPLRLTKATVFVFVVIGIVPFIRVSGFPCPRVHGSTVCRVYGFPEWFVLMGPDRLSVSDCLQKRVSCKGGVCVAAAGAFALPVERVVGSSGSNRNPASCAVFSTWRRARNGSPP